MLAWKRWTATAAVGGLLLFGGPGTAVSQQAEEPGLDVDALAAQLELDDEGRADLEQLARVVDRRLEIRRQMQAMHGEMMGVMRSLQQDLTREQRIGLHRAMQQVMRDGAGMRGGTGMRSGMMGPGMHGRGAGHHGMGARGSGGMMMPRSGARAPGAGGGMHPDCPWVSGDSTDTGGSGS